MHSEVPMVSSSSDGLTGCELLRGLVFGEKSNSEIQARLDALSGTSESVQGLAFELTGLTVPEDTARAVFKSLAAHLQDLRAALKRPIGVRTAALDLSDRLESFLREEGVVRELSHESLVRMAFVDYLTGLPNFRSLSERFESEIKRAQRYGRLLSLIMVDLDGFKAINDRFGHLAGNAALKHVAALLRNFIRETDVTGRYGGDEFMVLLPETAKHMAEGLAEGIRASILATPLNLKGHGPLPLTISLGMASFPRDARTAATLMAEADGALYNAKRAGRNQACFSRPKTSAVLSLGPFAAQTYHCVHVIGDFNGWDRTAEPMTWDPLNRYFAIELFLAPGKYQYKLLLDKEEVTSDPGNPELVDDGFGGRNSVLTVS